MYKIEKAGQKFTYKTIIGGQKIMNEQNHNNEKKVERVSTPSAKSNAKKQSIWHKIKKMNKENKFYLYTAVSCAAVLMAIVVVALAISNNGGVNQEAGKGSASHSSSVEKPDSSENSTENKPVVNTPEGMIMPVGTVMLGSDYGFYYNQTLNSYYEHAGVDFMATACTEVFAAEDGTIESIYKDDLLSGTEIVVNHGNGLKNLYRFVTEAEGLKVGRKVKKGDVIATVAEANGDEYKDGAHLHFEVLKNNQSVDPATYLTLEEK